MYWLKNASAPLRLAWKGLLIGIFLLSITLNVAALVGGALFTTVSTALSAATGMVTLLSRHSDEMVQLNAEVIVERRVKREAQLQVADLGEDLVVVRGANRELSGQVDEIGDQLADSRLVARQTRAELAKTSAELAAATTVTRQLRTELSETTGELAADRAVRREMRAQVGNGLVDFRGTRVALREAVAQTADGVSDRASRSASREMASMAGEALPYVGAAVIIGVTALEIADLCQTIRDMNELKRTFNPDLAPSEDQLTVCSMAVPSRQELWAASLEAPGKAWGYSRDAVPSIEDLQAIDLPSWRDVLSLWNGVRDGAQGAWDGSLERGQDIFTWMTE